MSNVVLELANVSKMYDLGDQTFFALKNVSLQITKGEFVAVVGPSGSGKSTLMHVASLLDSVSEGEVKINGVATHDYNEVERARLRNREIGFVFQAFNLLPKTSALENTALPLLYAGVSEKERQVRARGILEQVGLGDKINNTPARLSGGQQQRVAIARALINEPALLFADEPTGNLDSKSGMEIKKILIRLNNEGKTVVMVTHDATIAQIAKRVISMQDGEIVGNMLTKWGRVKKP